MLLCDSRSFALHDALKVGRHVRDRFISSSAFRLRIRLSSPHPPSVPAFCSNPHVHGVHCQIKSHFDRILSNPEKFCTWFWKDINGNKLIKALNSNNRKSRGSKIRRLHEWWLNLYCVVSENDHCREWKYCKVGITEKKTKTGVSNRMETVRKKIMKTSNTRQNLGHFKNTGIVFVLPCSEGYRF